MTLLSQTKSDRLSPQADFHLEATSAMSGLARTLSELIAALPCERKRPVDVERALQIDASLAWQMVQIATAENPLAASMHVPGGAAMNRVLRAAQERGVSDSVVNAVRDAYHGFEGVVACYCNDRPSFDTMVYDLHGQDDRKSMLRHKRAAYRANMHLWGVHAGTVVNCVVYNIDAKGWLECAHLRLYVGVKRLRPNIPYPLKLTAWRSVEQKDGTWAITPVKEREPIEPGDMLAGGTSLMPSFCSDPPPEIRIRRLSLDVHGADIIGETIGNSSASTCVVGDVLRRIAPWPIPGDDQLGSRLWIEAPAEAAICDLLVPIGLSDRQAPTVSAYRYASGSEGVTHSRDHEALTVSEDAHYAGVGPAAVRMAEYPLYPRLIESVCERLGWNAESYDVYRCRVRFPVLHSGIEMNARIVSPG